MNIRIYLQQFTVKPELIRGLRVAAHEWVIIGKSGRMRVSDAQNSYHLLQGVAV
jgi:hypothetical protein